MLGFSKAGKYEYTYRQSEHWNENSPSRLVAIFF